MFEPSLIVCCPDVEPCVMRYDALLTNQTLSAFINREADVEQHVLNVNKPNSTQAGLNMDATQSKPHRLSVRPEWRDKRLSLVASIGPNLNTADAAKSPTMEQSPLTQQTRPDVFEPKIVGLYKALFQVGSLLVLYAILF